MPHTAAHFSPLHISGSSSLLLSHTCSCLSCTCEQSLAPMDHPDLDPSTVNRLKATPNQQNNFSIRTRLLKSTQLSMSTEPNLQ